MMPQYRKKPVVIEARQWDGGVPGSVVLLVEWINGHGGSAHYKTGKRGHEIADQRIEIATLEGPITASFGDYIIKGVLGEFYPCKSDVFAKTYKAV